MQICGGNIGHTVWISTATCMHQETYEVHTGQIVLSVSTTVHELIGWRTTRKQFGVTRKI